MAAKERQPFGVVAAFSPLRVCQFLPSRLRLFASLRRLLSLLLRLLLRATVRAQFVRLSPKHAQRNVPKRAPLLREQSSLQNAALEEPQPQPNRFTLAPTHKLNTQAQHTSSTLNSQAFSLAQVAFSARLT